MASARRKPAAPPRHEALTSPSAPGFDVDAEAPAPNSGGDAGKRAGGRRDFKGYYRRLGLHDDGGGEHAITSHTIKEAYRQRVKDLHPDRHHGRPEREQAAVRERFQELQAAYEVLRDDAQRKLYDAGRSVER